MSDDGPAREGARPGGGGIGRWMTLGFAAGIVVGFLVTLLYIYLR